MWGATAAASIGGDNIEHAPICLFCDRPAKIVTREVTSACQTVLDRKILSVKASSELLQRSAVLQSWKPTESPGLLH